MSRGWQNNWWSRGARPLRKHSRLAWVGKHDFKASDCHFTLRLVHLLPPPRILCRGTLWRRAGGRAALFHSNPIPRRHAPQELLTRRSGCRCHATAPSRLASSADQRGRSVLRTGLASVLNRRTAFTFRRAGGQAGDPFRSSLTPRLASIAISKFRRHARPPMDE
jgi:hypothetical protein